MKAGDVSGGHTSSQETWLSAPLCDPNAALWASITPPANPDISTLIRRRAAAFSLDMLAQRLHLRFPAYFSSRSTARTGILGAAVAFGASVGVIGFLALGAGQRSAADLSQAREASAIEALRPAAAALAPAPSERPTGVATSLARQGETALDTTRAAATMTTTATMPPTFATGALPMAAEPAVVTPQQRRAQLQERRAAAKAKARAKRAASAKNTKATALRATKSRRARALME